MSSLAIIGSAGRRDDAGKITIHLWDTMVVKAKTVIGVLADDYGMLIDRLVSGGAAFVDQIAVTMFIAQHASNQRLATRSLPKSVELKLDLCLPCKFDLEKSRFVERHGGHEADPGALLNHYHCQFSNRVGFDSLATLALALGRPDCTVSLGGSLKGRNTMVAMRADSMLAMTFGQGPLVKPGGTADTVRKFLDRPDHGPAFHLDLATDLCYRNMKV